MKPILLVLASRGRYEKAKTAYVSWALTTSGQSELLFAVDEDDDPRYQRIADGRPDVTLSIMPPKRVGPAIDARIMPVAQNEERTLIGIMGDDNRILTVGWEYTMLDAVAAAGGTGIFYPDDGHQKGKLATLPFVTPDIILALGYFSLPGLAHYYGDQVLHEIGEAAGCLHYLPNILFDHLHPDAGKAPVDETYRRARACGSGDTGRFHLWKTREKAKDVAKVKALLEAKR